MSHYVVRGKEGGSTAARRPTLEEVLATGSSKGLFWVFPNSVSAMGKPGGENSLVRGESHMCAAIFYEKFRLEIRRMEPALQ